ncbi:hypothetical protein FGLOB1_4363 [Fusarium globosum]|uniref:Uncharacterized protein n=1 Tax=Fusarium globosum TaxID=78864 RepID=A0A8H6DDQ7_9HYPO|nr:hypothetical protein FGLOB1_4363 [Fusarium globosum]
MLYTEYGATGQPGNSRSTPEPLQNPNRVILSSVSRRLTSLDDTEKRNEVAEAVRRIREFIARNSILLLTPMIFILLALSLWDFVRPGPGHRAFWINFFGILSQAANLTLLFEDLQLLIGEALAVLISPIANNFVELSLLVASCGPHSDPSVAPRHLHELVRPAQNSSQDKQEWCAKATSGAYLHRYGHVASLSLLRHSPSRALRLLPGHKTAFHHAFQALAWLKLLSYLALVVAQFYEQIHPDHLHRLVVKYLPCWAIGYKERASNHSDQGGEYDTTMSTTHVSVQDEEACLNGGNDEQNPLLGPKDNTNDVGEEEDEDEKTGRLLDMMLSRWKPFFPQNTKVWMLILVSFWMLLNSVATAVQGDWLADGINRWLGKPQDPVTLGLIPLVGAAPEHIIAVFLVILSPYRFPDVIITTVLSGLNLSNFVGPIIQLYAWHISEVWIELEDDWRHPMIACVMSLSIFVSFRHGVVRLGVILLNIALLTILYATDFSDVIPR